MKFSVSIHYQKFIFLRLWLISLMSTVYFKISLRILKRLIIGAISIFIIVSIIYFLLQTSPSKPNFLYANIDEETRKILIRKYGLDKSIYEQFLIFWQNFFTRFEFGPSISRPGSDAGALIGARLPWTLLFTTVGFIISVLLAIGSSVLIAMKMNGPADNIFKILIPIFLPIPSFIISLIFVVAMGGANSSKLIFMKEDIATWIAPILTIAIPYWFIFTNFIRTDIYASMREQYVRFAKVKGLPPTKIAFKHALRQSTITTVSIMPIIFVSALIGASIVEIVFGIPGIGQLYQSSAQGSDYGVILGMTMFFSAVTILAYILRDGLIVTLNPKLRRQVSK